MAVNIIYIILALVFSVRHQQEVKAIHLTGAAQGTTWNITYFATEDVVMKSQLDSIFNKIDSSLSLYKPYSLIVQFNNSRRGVKMDEHLKKIVESSLQTTSETKGLSDITVGPLIEAWGFGAKQSKEIPTSEETEKLLDCVGARNISIRGDSLVKLKPCVKIDANGIAQGYTVDIIADFIESKGVNDYLVEVGGELRVKGTKKPAGVPFRIGIESPSGDDFSTPPMQKIVELKDGAITTSGNYRKYHESKGKRYSHIIDPRTGKSVDNEMISATVFAKDAITADAYDNALMLMGMKDALKFIEKRPGMAAFIIYRNADGTVADTASSRFRNLIVSNN